MSRLARWLATLAEDIASCDAVFVSCFRIRFLAHMTCFKHGSQQTRLNKRADCSAIAMTREELLIVVRAQGLSDNGTTAN